MISAFDASLDGLSIHRVGNKLRDEYLKLSDCPVRISDPVLNNLLLRYFTNQFGKVNELHQFYHPTNNLDLNEIFHLATAIFDDPATLHENSQQIARHLFDITGHPNIRPGELYVACFRNIQLGGELCDAVGIFKSETKDSYLKVVPEGDNLELVYEQEAISTERPDKACLILRTAKEEGYKVAVTDHLNRGAEAVYWKDDFLKLKTRNDSYSQTNNILGVYKNFVTNKLDEEFEMSKTDKIDLLNRSMNYFKEKESFDLDEFSSEVIGNPQGIASFRNYKKEVEEEFDSPIADAFDISDAAVKKQARVYKSVLKLDRNFHIYIHGDKQLIEKGFDESKSMNYYKVYFKQES